MTDGPFNPGRRGSGLHGCAGRQSSLGHRTSISPDARSPKIACCGRSGRQAPANGRRSLLSPELFGPPALGHVFGHAARLARRSHSAPATCAPRHRNSDEGMTAARRRRTIPMPRKRAPAPIEADDSHPVDASVRDRQRPILMASASSPRQPRGRDCPFPPVAATLPVPAAWPRLVQSGHRRSRGGRSATTWPLCTNSEHLGDAARTAPLVLAGRSDPG
jgi:hypothetical protein